MNSFKIYIAVCYLVAIWIMTAASQDEDFDRDLLYNKAMMSYYIRDKSKLQK